MYYNRKSQYQHIICLRKTSGTKRTRKIQNNRRIMRLYKRRCYGSPSYPNIIKEAILLGQGGDNRDIEMCDHIYNHMGGAKSSEAWKVTKDFNITLTDFTVFSRKLFRSEHRIKIANYQYWGWHTTIILHISILRSFSDLSYIQSMLTTTRRL